MPIPYNIEDDIRFQQGFEKGFKIGREEVIKNLLSANLSHQQIADCLKIPLKMV